MGHKRRLKFSRARAHDKPRRNTKEQVMAKKGGKGNLVRLVSSADTGTFIVRKKNPKATEKLKRRMYDPKTRTHVIFEEKKMPPHKK